MQKRILLVDDDNDLVELIGFNLRKAGFDILVANDGIAALELARDESPDLVLLDVMMPELNGFEVCETLRRNPSTSTVPVVMLTAMPGEFSRIFGLEAGATEYHSKPFKVAELVGRIRALTAN